MTAKTPPNSRQCGPLPGAERPNQREIRDLILLNADGKPLNARQRQLYRVLGTQTVEPELLGFFQVEIETFNKVFFLGADRRKFFASKAQGAYS